jgi:hypothetical protein
VVAEAEKEMLRIEELIKAAEAKGVSLPIDQNAIDARKKRFKGYKTRSKWKKM